MYKRQVLHIQCDSETTLKVITTAVSGKHIKHNTPNRDLIMRCAAEMKWRHDQPSFKTEWHDVESPLGKGAVGAQES